MANYAVAAGEIGTHNHVLGAAVEDVVTFDRDCDTVEVVNLDGIAAIYFSVDDSVAAVAGNNTYVIPAVVGAALIVDVRASPGDTKVRLISAGAPSYSVMGSL